VEGCLKTNPLVQGSVNSSNKEWKFMYVLERQVVASNPTN